MPTVCKITLDATEYRRELAAVVAASREAARTLAAVSSAPSVDAPSAGVSAPSEPVELTVTADTSGAEAAIDKLENTPVKIEAKVTADTSQAEQAIDKLADQEIEVDAKVDANPAAVEATKKQVEQTGEAAKRAGGFLSRLIPESLRNKAAQAFGAVRQEMTKTEGGAGQFMEAFKAGGGLVGILIAGVTSLGTIAMSVYNNWINAMKDAADVARRNTESIREVSQANEALRQKTDNYLSKLSDLAASEQLSNAGKAEAIMLINQLTQSYGDLGVTLDATTGKLVGFDEAMAKKLRKDHAQKIWETEAELRNLQSDNNAQRDLMNNAGISGWWLAGIPQLLTWDRNTRIGGEEQAKEAGEKISENDKRATELRRQLRDLKKNDPVEQFRKSQAAKLADLKESYQQQTESFEQRKFDDAFNSETDPDAKIANRQALINNLRQTKIAPLAKQIVAAERKLETATGDDRVEAERNLVQLKKQMQAEQEKIYHWNQQIESVIKQQDSGYNNLVNSTKDELEYNALIIAGEYDKAAALKLEQELKAQNLKLTKEEKDAILEQRKALGSQNLKRNLQDQAFDLYGQAMNKAGLGKEFEMQKALRDAERAKGAELTEEEANQVKMLTSLSYDLANQRDMQFGDTSIKTNSLTSRGGFSGGAKMPDSEKINREIATTSKLQLEQMKIITMICEKLGAF